MLGGRDSWVWCVHTHETDLTKFIVGLKEPSNSFISLSQSGFIFLQCPHLGGGLRFSLGLRGLDN